MTDKELLELAAKAAGIDGQYASLDEFPDWMTCHDGEGIYFTGSQAWNPLTDDGDALRLAVKLNLAIYPKDESSTGIWSTVSHNDKHMGDEFSEKYSINNNDPYAATRRAIVRAAAEIGKGMV